MCHNQPRCYSLLLPTHPPTARPGSQDPTSQLKLCPNPVSACDKHIVHNNIYLQTNTGRKKTRNRTTACLDKPPSVSLMGSTRSRRPPADSAPRRRLEASERPLEAPLAPLLRPRPRPSPRLANSRPLARPPLTVTRRLVPWAMCRSTSPSPPSSTATFCPLQLPPTTTEGPPRTACRTRNRPTIYEEHPTATAMVPVTSK